MLMLFESYVLDSGVIPARPVKIADCKKTKFEKAMAKAWYVALILTRSPRLAEQAVVDAMDLWDLDPAFEGRLWLFAIAASLKLVRTGTNIELEELEAALRLLPVELQQIACCSFVVRACFVLRVFAGLSEGVCAGIVGIDCQQVNEYTARVISDLTCLEVD